MSLRAAVEHKSAFLSGTNLPCRPIYAVSGLVVASCWIEGFVPLPNIQFSGIGITTSDMAAMPTPTQPGHPLRDLQRDALDPNVAITLVLRKARGLAARLKNAEFEAWIQHALNGYSDLSDLPEYRILSANSKAYLIIGWTQIPSADVMPSQIPEEFRHWATTSYVHSPITELASLIEEIDSKRTTIALAAGTGD
jgi:hypothetical protein